MSAPFHVRFDSSSTGPKWVLWMRQPKRLVGWFDTPADAANHARTNWPWWP